MASATADLQGDTLSGHSSALNVSDRGLSPTNYAIFQNVGTMRTYLGTQSYTAAQLTSMTKRDMIYACRVALGLN